MAKTHLLRPILTASLPSALVSPSASYTSDDHSPLFRPSSTPPRRCGFDVSEVSEPIRVPQRCQEPTGLSELAFPRNPPKEKEKKRKKEGNLGPITAPNARGRRRWAAHDHTRSPSTPAPVNTNTNRTHPRPHRPPLVCARPWIAAGDRPSDGHNRCAAPLPRGTATDHGSRRRRRAGGAAALHSRKSTVGGVMRCDVVRTAHS